MNWCAKLYGGALLLVLVAGATQADAVSVCVQPWSVTLKAGMTSADMLRLQHFLNADPDTAVAASGVGSAGQESTYYGARTAAAVRRFQEKYAAAILTPSGLTAGTGIVGAATRAKLNALCAAAASSSSASLPASATTLTPSVDTSLETPTSTADLLTSSVATSTLTVSLAPQPPSMLAVQGALYVPFTRFTLTAGSQDVTVAHVTIERKGPSQDGAFSYVSLLDEDGNELSYAYLHADHTATFPDSFVVPAGTSMTLTVAGDMASDLSGYVGQAATLQVDAIDAEAMLVGASLPLSGTSQSMNATLPIGSATALRSSYDPDAPRTRYVNDTNVIFSGIQITAGATEDLLLKSISWRQDGSASNGDIANVQVVADGVAYPTDVDDHYYTATFADPIRIPKGNSIDVYSKGDIGTTGSNRTVQFDINENTDVLLVGASYGYGISLVPAGNTDTSGTSVFLTDDGTPDGNSLQPFYAGPIVTISPGALNSLSK